jgi:hypothetical protein
MRKARPVTGKSMPGKSAAGRSTTRNAAGSRTVVRAEAPARRDGLAAALEHAEFRVRVVRSGKQYSRKSKSPIGEEEQS